jgi:hypothetical protein
MTIAERLSAEEKAAHLPFEPSHVEKVAATKGQGIKGADNLKVCP